VACDGRDTEAVLGADDADLDLRIDVTFDDPHRIMVVKGAGNKIGHFAKMIRGALPDLQSGR